MRKKGLFMLAFMAVALAASAQYTTLEIGDKAPYTTYKMENTNGKMLSFDDVKKDNGTLVIFSCNTCPFVLAWENRYPKVAQLASENNVGLMLVNSNQMKRDGDDSMDAMKKHASDHNYNWPYLVDVDSKLANAYGAMTTPHVFLFDKNNKLVYLGAIDDNYKDASQVKDFYLKDALESLASGKAIAENITRATGCSIKRMK
ncbi:thioredoxin family protein [Saccharicrinis sp. FJH62]|uniref:thioredoxin family protein n=1 Tax=Saccharicrinis sp. FJH62 TaxID=3344657 RepID=UPI0035D4F167